jgi:hypothetical protein
MLFRLNWILLLLAMILVLLVGPLQGQVKEMSSFYWFWAIFMVSWQNLNPTAVFSLTVIVLQVNFRQK